MQPVTSTEIKDEKPDREERVRRIIHVDMDFIMRRLNNAIIRSCAANLLPSAARRRAVSS